MAQLYDASKNTSFQGTPTSAYKTPPAQASSPTIEQLLQGDGTVSQAAVTSGKHNEYEGDPIPNRKSSVLDRVREKAKKLKHTLSNKRIRQSNIDSEYEPENENDNDNGIPNCNYDVPDDKTIRSMDVNLDEDEIDEDPEYLGAPIYESVQAPEECKETVKQHPREVIASAEKHIIESCPKSENKKDDPTHSPRKTMTETVSEKLGPAYNAMSNATQAITSKISSLSVETPASADNNISKASPRSIGQGPNSSPHTYDKGVSVKEYLMQKFEPGENERALSQVITDAISPKGAMMGKMKEAVSSYLQQSSDSAATKTETNDSTKQKSLAASKTFATSRDPAYKASTQNPIVADIKADSLSESNKMKSKSCNAVSNATLSSFIPISTNSQEGTKEENQGRILQPN